MFNTIIRFSLNNRLAVIVAAVFLAAAGFVCMRKMPVDVLPDLNRPRVVVMAESPGMAPEEVETLPGIRLIVTTLLYFQEVKFPLTLQTDIRRLMIISVNL